MLLLQQRAANYRWVHSVCALYTAGVTFGDVDTLKPVILSEIPSDKWKSRVNNFIPSKKFSCNRPRKIGSFNGTAYLESTI